MLYYKFYFFCCTDTHFVKVDRRQQRTYPKNSKLRSSRAWPARDRKGERREFLQKETLLYWEIEPKCQN